MISKIYLQYGAIIFFAMLTALCFKKGVSENGPFQLNLQYIIKFLFHPMILVALIAAFIGRFLWALPLQEVGVGHLALMVTPLSLIAIIAGSHLFFKETFTQVQLIGVVLAIVSIVFLEMK